MGYLYLFASIIGFVIFVFVFSRAEKAKRTGIQFASLVVLFLCLVWANGRLGDLLLFTLIALKSLDHIPSWVFYVVGIGLICFIVWYVFKLLGNGIIDLAQENQKTNARIALLENSVREKLDDVLSRLPKKDGPFP